MATLTFTDAEGSTRMNYVHRNLASTINYHRLSTTLERSVGDGLVKRLTVDYFSLTVSVE